MKRYSAFFQKAAVLLVHIFALLNRAGFGECLQTVYGSDSLCRSSVTSASRFNTKDALLDRRISRYIPLILNKSSHNFTCRQRGIRSGRIIKSGVKL